MWSFAVVRKCKRIILVHNHPESSKADRKITEEFVKGGFHLEIV